MSQAEYAWHVGILSSLFLLIHLHQLFCIVLTADIPTAGPMKILLNTIIIIHHLKPSFFNSLFWKYTCFLSIPHSGVVKPFLTSSILSIAQKHLAEIVKFSRHLLKKTEDTLTYPNSDQTSLLPAFPRRPILISKIFFKTAIQSISHVTKVHV